MQPPRRLQVHPEVLLLLMFTRYQIVERYCGVGIENIIDWCFMEHGDAQRVGILHFVDKFLVPDWIKRLLLDAGSICGRTKQRQTIRFTVPF
jgi:hypothetical protein